MIIQKYGGTSLRNLNKESNVLKNIKACLAEGHRLVVVVSAIGRKGEPYATDTLIGLLEDINSNIAPKKKDLIMSCGEIISCTKLSHLLDSEDISSEALTGFQAGIFTDENFNSAEIKDIDISNIKNIMAHNQVVVVAGFQGATKENEITTLGRGGSDTTAVALGGYLGAERVDIFTDVPGVAITDPKLVPDARFIDHISYENMYHLASNGAKIIHPIAISMGAKFNIPIRITSTETNVSGTLISGINNENHIAGIAVAETEDKMIFTILINNMDVEVILKDLDKFLYDNKKDILNINVTKDQLSLSTIKENKSILAKDLYNLLIKYN